MTRLARPAGLAAKSNGVQDRNELFRQLIADFPPDALRGAFVWRWAACNGVSLDILQGQVTSRFLSKAEQYPHLRKTPLEHIFPCGTLKDLESVFERLIGHERRKEFGAVYTPNYIIDYLVRTSLRFGWHDKSRLPRLYDPSCGCAGFLIRAANILYEDYGIERREAFQSCLYGSDKDPHALENARCLIELSLAAHEVNTPPELHLYEMDPLLADPDEIGRRMDVQGGFNAVTTNPPYVKLQTLDLDYRAALTRCHPGFTQGSFSLAPLFLLAGQRALAPDGCLAFITQNNLFTSLSGLAVRRELQRKECIRRIVDFGHNKIFAGASAYTCLIFLGARPSETFEYDDLNGKVGPGPLGEAEFTHIRHDQLKPAKWRLVKEDHAANIRTLETIGRPLGEVASIRVGFATLKDAVFLVRDAGDRCVTVAPNGRVCRIEKELTRPAVKIADLESASDLAGNDRRIIFPYERCNGKYRLMPEEKLASLYPNAYHHLTAHREELAARDSGRKEYGGWYAWGRTQSMEAPGPKLLTKTFSKQPRFMLDGSDQLFCNGYAVFARSAGSLFTDVSLGVLGRILNSSVMHYYAKLTSFQIEGGYQCYQKNFIEHFGIVDMSEDQASRLMELPESEADNYVSTLYGLRSDALDQVLCRP